MVINGMGILRVGPSCIGVGIHSRRFLWKAEEVKLTGVVEFTTESVAFKTCGLKRHLYSYNSANFSYVSVVIIYASYKNWNLSLHLSMSRSIRVHCDSENSGAEPDHGLRCTQFR